MKSTIVNHVLFEIMGWFLSCEGIISYMEYGTWNMGNLELGTWNLELGTWNLELGSWNLDLET